MTPVMIVESRNLNYPMDFGTFDYITDLVGSSSAIAQHRPCPLQTAPTRSPLHAPPATPRSTLWPRWRALQSAAPTLPSMISCSQPLWYRPPAWCYGRSQRLRPGGGS